MRHIKLAAFALGGLLGSLSVPACDLDVPDLNNPSLDDLENNPTAVSISAACTGLLVGNRRNHAAANGYVSQLGILGRESYNFDTADPRYIDEMLAGKLSPASPFGGNFWAAPYANIRLANIVLGAVEKVTDLSAMNKAAIRGFTKTIIALDLLEVIVTHDTNGAVIDTDRDPLAPLGAIVDKAMVYTEIVRLLETAVTDLDAGGTAAFPFAVSKGFSAFNAPPSFRTFNRAIRARVAAYLGDYPGVLTALTGSFINDNPAILDFDAGAYYTYSTKPSDTPNALINPNIFVHPKMKDDAQMNGPNIDARFARKTGTANQPGTAGERTATLAYKGLYPDPESSVPLIRNEELILLKAEALFFTNNVAGAVTELNIVRTNSGRLPEQTGLPSMATFVDQLLYERRYSLMFEGHRWIDARRLGRLASLPIFIDHDDAGKEIPDTLNVRYPIPQPECNARPGEPRCMLGSTD
jgi:starch-binding outer membrane protein, SusD/RagB family